MLGMGWSLQRVQNSGSNLRRLGWGSEDTPSALNWHYTPAWSQARAKPQSSLPKEAGRQKEGLQGTEPRNTICSADTPWGIQPHITFWVSWEGAWAPPLNHGHQGNFCTPKTAAPRLCTVPSTPFQGPGRSGHFWVNGGNLLV